jgi:hypothetical protein
MGGASVSLAVLRTLGGCGSTILCRALEAATGTVVLSETNPRSAKLFGGKLNPLQQVRTRWPHLIPEKFAHAELSLLQDEDWFAMFIAEFCRVLAECVGQRLIIRDYNYIDFLSIPFLTLAPCDSSLNKSLEKFTELSSLLLVRHPAHQLASLLSHLASLFLLSHKVLQEVLSPEHFVQGSLAFLDTFAGYPVIKYEDFLADPDRTLAKISEYWNLRFDPTWQSKLGHQYKLTGDARGRSSHNIAAPAQPHAHTPQLVSALTEHPDYDLLLSRLDYTNRE